LSERLKEIADRWMEEVWRERNLDTIDELYAPHYQDRSLPDHSPGLGPYKASVAELFAAFPDFYAFTEDLVIDDAGNKVAVLWTATGTHRGTFRGGSPRPGDASSSRGSRCSGSRTDA
jgi:predicted ester cyclase